MNKKKKIVNKALSLLLCLLMIIPVISLYAYAEDGDCSEWDLTAAVAYDYDSTSGTAFSEDQTDITISDYDQGHTVTVRVWYVKNIGTTTYDPDTNPVKITVPFLLDGAVCSNQSTRTISNMVSVKNPNTEMFSAKVESDGSVVVSNKTTIDADTTLTGYFDVLYCIGTSSYKVYLINDELCSVKANINDKRDSNEINCSTDIANRTYTSREPTIKSYDCVLDAYQDYYFVLVSPYNGVSSYNATQKTGGGIPYNLTQTAFTVECKDEDADIIVCDTNFNPITADENGQYVVGYVSNSSAALVGFPKNLYSQITVTTDIYGKNSNCTYRAADGGVIYSGDTAHESENLEKIMSGTAEFDPQEYIRLTGDATFEEVYFNDKYTNKDSTESTYYGKDYSLIDNVALSEDAATIKVAQYAYVPLDMTDKTLRIAVNGVSLTDADGNSKLLSGDEYQIASYNAYRLFGVSYDTSNNPINKKLTFSFYIKQKGQDNYSLYKTISKSSYPSVSLPSEVESFYVDITGFTNGVGYASGIVSAYYPFYTSVNISKTDTAPGCVYRVIGSMDVLDADGNSCMVPSDTENVLSYGIDSTVGAVYDSLPFLVNQKTYTPEIKTRVTGQYNNDAQTPVCNIYAYLYNSANVPYKANSTFTVELPDAAYKVVPSTGGTSKTTASDIYIVNEKKYINLTCANANYGVMADIYMDPDTYFEYSNTYSFTTTNTDFAKSEKYAYSTDTLTDTKSVTVSLPASAHEGADCYVAKQTLYSKDLTKVSDDGTYMYKLRLSPAGEVTDTVMYCNLETAYGSNSYWQGTLQSIDVSQVEKLGYSVKSYFSANADAGTLSTDSSWQEITSDTDLSSVKSLAFEILTSDGSSAATIPAGTLLSVILGMKAPETISVAHAYNSFYAQWTPVSTGTAVIVPTSNTTEAYINPPCSISVNVVDKDGNPVTDEFSFEIYKGTDKISSFTSDGTTYTEETLTEGDYMVTCTDKPYWYEDVPDQSITLATGEDGTVTFTVNTYSATLPEAGAGTLILLISTVLALLTIVFVIRINKKQEAVV